MTSAKELSSLFIISYSVTAIGQSRINHCSEGGLVGTANSDWIHFISHEQYIEESAIIHSSLPDITMQYADDIEMWNMDLDSSPFATLTADFADFKKKFHKIFSGRRSESSPGSSSESSVTSRNLGYDIKVRNFIVLH